MADAHPTLCPSLSADQNHEEGQSFCGFVVQDSSHRASGCTSLQHNGDKSRCQQHTERDSDLHGARTHEVVRSELVQVIPLTHFFALGVWPHAPHDEVARLYTLGRKAL